MDCGEEVVVCICEQVHIVNVVSGQIRLAGWTVSAVSNIRYL